MNTNTREGHGRLGRRARQTTTASHLFPTVHHNRGDGAHSSPASRVSPTRNDTSLFELAGLVRFAPARARLFLVSHE